VILNSNESNLPLVFATTNREGGRPAPATPLVGGEPTRGELVEGESEFDRKAAGLRSAHLLRICTANRPASHNPAPSDYGTIM